jgi:hypothetical protein
MGQYDNDWKEYRSYRNAVFWVWLSYVPVVVLVATISIKLFDTLVPGFVTAIFWSGLFVFAAFRFQLWRCPRCNNCFSGKWWYNLSFVAKRCVHCGLPKYGDE